MPAVMANIMMIAMSLGGELHVPRTLDLERLLARTRVWRRTSKLPDRGNRRRGPRPQPAAVRSLPPDRRDHQRADAQLLQRRPRRAGAAPDRRAVVRGAARTRSSRSSCRPGRGPSSARPSRPPSSTSSIPASSGRCAGCPRSARPRPTSESSSSTTCSWSCAPGSITGNRARPWRTGAPDRVTRSTSSSMTESRSKRRRHVAFSQSTCGACGRWPRSGSSSDASSSAARSAPGSKTGSRSGRWSFPRRAVGQCPVSQPTLPPEGAR